MKTMKKNPGSKGRRFDEEFRREAVALLERGRSATQLARELGVSTWSLCQWKKRYCTQGAAGEGRAGSTSIKGSTGDRAATDEVLRLRGELHAVSLQRDIV